MIWESECWKDDLLRKASHLRKRKTQQRWPESSHAKLEQAIMLGFYSVRKLYEADKLSTATMTKQLPLITYPWNGKRVTKLNWHKIDQLYDFSSPKKLAYDSLFLSNQFVHSYIFLASFDEHERLEGILFASDHQRHKALLHVTIDQVATFFEQVGKDYPAKAHRVLNPKKGDYELVLSM